MILSAKMFNLFALLIPIWVACLMYGVVFVKCYTFNIKHDKTMDSVIIGHVEIPHVSMQYFITLRFIVLVLMYNYIFVTLPIKFTGLKHYITMLQRMGFGTFIFVLAMIVGSLIELKKDL